MIPRSTHTHTHTHTHTQYDHLVGMWLGVASTSTCKESGYIPLRFSIPWYSFWEIRIGWYNESGWKQRIRLWSISSGGICESTLKWRIKWSRTSDEHNRILERWTKLDNGDLNSTNRLDYSNTGMVIKRVAGRVCFEWLSEWPPRRAHGFFPYSVQHT